MPEAVTDDAPGRTVLSIVKKRWRAWLRALHRDLGYLTVGLTIIYAVSGLALNHIGQWDPNFTTVHRELTIEKIPAEVPDDVAIARAAKAVGLGDDAVKGAARYGDEIHFEAVGGTVVVYGDTGLVVEDARSSRFFLRLANWLHEVRGKRAWSYIADAYAVILLFLAVGGLFMIKGRLGLRWRGAMLVGAGVLVPVMYVALAGGPGAKAEKAGDAGGAADGDGAAAAKAGPADGDGAADGDRAAKRDEAPAAAAPAAAPAAMDRGAAGAAAPTAGGGTGVDVDGDGPVERPPVRMQPRMQPRVQAPAAVAPTPR